MLPLLHPLLQLLLLALQHAPDTAQVHGELLQGWESGGCSGDGKQGLFPVFGPQSSHPCPVSTSPVTPCPLLDPQPLLPPVKHQFILPWEEKQTQEPRSFPLPTDRRPDLRFLTSYSITPLVALAHPPLRGPCSDLRVAKAFLPIPSSLPHTE